MFLTISLTGSPGTDATDLGFLLHKHPERPQSQSLAVGTAHVFYPEATARRCTAALLLEVDPVGLVRGRRRGDAFALGNYVNDRPYAASSLLAVALGRVFRTAMGGRCDARPELVGRALPLEVRVPALPCPGGPEAAREYFAPLGWRVSAGAVPLDATVPEWGESRYVDLTLTGEVRLADALSHLYVLLPALDGAKHYWVGPDEVDKLVRAGSGWLGAHPHRGRITRRYLDRRESLTRAALARLAEVDDLEPEALDDAVPADEAVEAVQRRVPLARLRRAAVLEVLRAAGARRVADLGCGSGALVAELLAEPAFTDVVAVDVSARALEVAARTLRLDRMGPRQRDRLRIFQSSLVYRDERLAGLDAAVLVEVVEHVDPSRLGALERCVFGSAAPGTVVVTTPNVEYNVRYETPAPGRFRHADHRFEWTRAEFAAWGARVAERYGYTVRLLPVGEVDPEVGSPTQLAVFTRTTTEEEVA
ncbi:3' terminal RNA ribose 2'-O-methyltransferase Hen1 [Pseudonocardia humida]|uniref:Small RNA 2'-O-methyltransferase n=1 Tax=Pseudonocardia humida TaxID=2800819 RepID=A0ABT1AB94_9PSEU|nr:3' terminal RNA ribose 2'-O-methyltransferase Hen1 [Pseudonocardia humida]MCO1660200.1 3' terminal RNA ribose 2'-O-methyltransferase Hen1 [Pseudonocardia humida]